MAKKTKKKSTKTSSATIKTRQGKLVGFTKVGSKFAFVFSKNRKNVVGKSRFSKMSTLKAKVKAMLRK